VARVQASLDSGRRPCWSGVHQQLQKQQKEAVMRVTSDPMPWGEVIVTFEGEEALVFERLILRARSLLLARMCDGVRLSPEEDAELSVCRRYSELLMRSR
jgi:hypothetical protein